MSGIWIWTAALLAFGAFLLWYDSWRGPLRADEIAGYVKRWEQATHPPEPDVLAAARAFLESDDGGEFFMVNLIRLHPGDVAVPGSHERKPARDVLQRYTGYFMSKLLRRAGHPAFVAPAAGRYLEHWGVEPDPGWTAAGIVRYRSRRDLMELATDSRFDPAHAYKIAAMAQTLAFPVAGGFQLFSPRVVVALALALLASLVHLATRLS